MSKKRNKYRSTKRSNTAAQQRVENSILASLYSSDKLTTTREISRLLSGKNVQKSDIKTAIEFLLSQNIIRKNSKHTLLLDKKASLYEGILEKTERGFGFVTETTSRLKVAPLARDCYISSAKMGFAHHGDRVLIRIARTGTDGRPEGVIIKTLSHGKDTLAGFYFSKNGVGTVSPEDPRFPFRIQVTDSAFNPQQGDAVIVRIERDNQSTTTTLSGEIVEVLGKPDNIDVQMRLVIEKFSLPHTFCEQAQHEAQKISTNFTASEERLDLRDIAHITIDGETAKDFDDAICVKKTANGFQLYVSIADVSYFVQAGSFLDSEAYLRGTSIYFPGRVIPMLPEKLSNNICSLIPGEDRYTVTAILSFDHRGTLLKKEFSRSIIRSHHRFSYTTVKQILIDKEPSVRHQHKPFLTQLKWAEELATTLMDKRKKRGSIGFNIPESEITLTDAGEVESITPFKRNFAHQLIEELMLAANEAVAELFSENHRLALYRVHAKPDPEKVAEFISFAKTIGIHLQKTDNSPKWFAGIIEQCRGTKTEYLVNNLLLRTMKQAHYSVENAGHFGLASADYTHFTSPIRRYPDLLVHRELISIIKNRQPLQKREKNVFRLQQKGDFLSARERVAIKAEREITNRLKTRYMKKYIGEKFEAIISGVNDFALFVELTDLGIRGSIGLDNLTDDYYLHDEKRYRLIGELSGTIYQIGDSIQVTLLDVDCRKNRINFIPAH